MVSGPRPRWLIRCCNTNPGGRTVTLDYRTAISVEPRAIGVTPAEPLAFSVTITNETRRSLRYEVELHGLERSQVTTTPGDVFLKPGESQLVVVEAMLPGFFPAGRHQAGIEIRSSHPDQPVVAFEDVFIDVQGVASARLDLPRSHLRARRRAKTQMELHNTGNQPVDFRFLGHSPEGKLQFRFQPAVVRVDPDDSAVVEVKVGSYLKLVGRKTIRAFDLIAQGPSGELSRDGDFEHKPVIAGWFFKFLAAVLLVVALLFLIRAVVRAAIGGGDEITWSELSDADGSSGAEVLGRAEHTAVWLEYPEEDLDPSFLGRMRRNSVNWFTGGDDEVESMLVWGGVGRPGSTGAEVPLSTGAEYLAESTQWILIDDTGAPSPRSLHTAAWTGETMVIWGGDLASPNPDDTGAEYTPTSNSWKPLPAGPLPPRIGHSMTWTGSHLIIFGGFSWSEDGKRAVSKKGAILRPGQPDAEEQAAGEPERALYGGTWTELSSFPGVARHDHSATWTGTHLVIFGGYDSEGVPLADAYALDPLQMKWDELSTADADAWTNVTRNPAPDRRGCHEGLWSGTQIVYLGGTSLSLSLDDAAEDARACAPIKDLPFDPDPYTLTPAVQDVGVAVNVEWTWDVPKHPPPEHLGASFQAIWTASEATVLQTVKQLDTIAASRYTPEGGTVNLPLPDEDTVGKNTGFTAIWVNGGVVVWGGRDGAGAPTNNGAELILPDR